MINGCEVVVCKDECEDAVCVLDSVACFLCSGNSLLCGMMTTTLQKIIIGIHVCIGEHSLSFPLASPPFSLFL